MILAPPLKLFKGPKGGRPHWSYLHKAQMEVYRSHARFKTVVAGRRWGKCLADDTMISMADGSEKPVQLVKEGDVVLTLNETTYAMEPRVVQHLHNNGVKETVVVKTAGRSLRCTPNHPLLVNNAWVEAGNIKKGDLVAVPRYLMQDAQPDELCNGDFGWEEITEVIASEQVQTWDLTIEGNHNFFAEGIVTHNTQLAKTEMIKEARKKGRLIWYIAPTYQMARQIMWQELLDSIPRRWIDKVNESRLEIRLRNRTIIQLKGADKPDALRGVGLHFVVMDEFQDMRPETWNTVIQPTLASTQGRVLWIGTPKSFNHLYDHYMRGQDPGETEWESWQFKTLTSPFILPEEIEQARRNMSEKEFAQEFNASFTTMSNRVYHAFDRNLHVKRVKFDPRKPILVGMDFNLDPMSAVLFQHDDDGRIMVFDEIILRNSNTFEMAEELEKRYWRHKKQIVIYPDPAGGQKSTQSRGESDISILRAKGFKKLKYRRKHPRVRDRVNSVNRMMRSADGTIRMLIDHSCKNFINSLEQTQYKKNSNDIDKAPSVEHATDAFGYGCELEHPVRELRVLGVSI